jgi:hypothetical protein
MADLRGSAVQATASVSPARPGSLCRICRRPADALVTPPGRFVEGYNYCAGCVNDAMERAEMERPNA